MIIRAWGGAVSYNNPYGDLFMGPLGELLAFVSMISGLVYLLELPLGYLKAPPGSAIVLYILLFVPLAYGTFLPSVPPLSIRVLLCMM